ncbi:hypothetical protein LXA43DRAFT_1104879 [Ganoderma leucocontextum]|nr:hypothetical protein LXA43DRAFT_1104879 [Ganoderma leucocontextum]
MSQPVVFLSPNEKCASPACARTNIAKGCTRRLCAKCCREFTTPCGFSKHHAKRAQQHAAHVAAAAARQPYAYAPQLARPPPVRRPLDPVYNYDVLPLTEDDAGAASQEGVMEEKRFQKDMHPAFRAAWDREKTVQAENARVEQQRRENEAALLHSIELLFWREDSKPAERYTVQGIKTWPTFVIQQSPSTCTFLSLSGGDLLDVYSLSALCWQAHDLSAVFPVQANQLLLLRRRGIVNCLELDAAIADARHRTQRRGTALSPIQVTVVLPKSTRPSKRAREPGSDGGRASSVPRLALSHTSPFLSPPASQLAPNPARPYLQEIHTYRSPSIVCSPSESSTVASPPMSSSPSEDAGYTLSGDALTPGIPAYLGLDFLGVGMSSPPAVFPTSIGPSGLGIAGASLPPSLPFVSPDHTPHLHPSSPLVSPPFHPSLANSPLPNQTSPPIEGSTIYNSELGHQPVPLPSQMSPPTARELDRMYACDVAQGFARIAANVAGKKNLQDRFLEAFPGVAFNSTTAYRHYKAWQLSSEDERARLLMLPRIEAGLWKVHRNKLTGWPLSRAR